jgi:hypothetical protein
MGEPSSESYLRKVAVPLASALVAGTVLGAGGYWWTSISESLSSAWDWLTNPVSVSRLWLGILWLFFLFVVVVAVLMTYAVLFTKDKKPHHAYVEDSFFGMYWRWTWVPGVGTTNFGAFCPACGRLLRWSEMGDGHYMPYRVRFYCQGCSYERDLDGSRGEVESKVQIEIMHRIETGAWTPEKPGSDRGRV